MKFDQDFREAFRFFHANAPYATSPGRAKCAKDLAVAEAIAADRGFEVDWTWDHAERDWTCTVRAGTDAESLGVIDNPDDNYQRLVEAGLAAALLERVDPGWNARPFAPSHAGSD